VLILVSLLGSAWGVFNMTSAYLFVQEGGTDIPVEGRGSLDQSSLVEVYTLLYYCAIDVDDWNRLIELQFNL